LIEDYSGIEACLRKLTAHAEKGVAEPWEYWLPEDLGTPEKVTRGIVGFEISVSKVNAKFKSVLSRSKEDQEGVIRGLIEERGDDTSRALAEMMRK
jgi:transcriptional regulator